MDEGVVGAIPQLEHCHQIVGIKLSSAENTALLVSRTQL
jgi:hypothetical protein